MGRDVDGKADVKDTKKPKVKGNVKIRFYGTLKPVRQVSFVDELKRVAKHYNLTVKIEN